MQNRKKQDTQEIHQLYAQIAQLKRVIQQKDDRIQELEEQLQTVYIEPNEHFGPIMNQVVERYLYFKQNEISKQMDVKEQKFWIAVKIKSPLVYAMLHNQFNLYHPNSINRLKYKYQEAKCIDDDIFSETFQAKAEYLSSYAKELKANGSNTVYVGLSSDFCYFNVQSYENEDGQLLPIRAACAFTICPYNRDLPKTLIYFKPAVDGSADDTIYQAMWDIKKALEKYHVHVSSFSVDGETYYNKYKREQFKQVYTQFQLNTASCYDYLSDQKQHMFQPDWLHEQKLMRYKFSSKPLSIAFDLKKGNYKQRIYLNDITPNGSRCI
ncbi:Hypothetical_protein [Hexamita inflata]|uniref:Hypothetical_protein n=1 Tax=Hexamita inflata TaxID=28002 RepID=A0AA86NHQ0_9EUKA|nr:Hypothetical protein HINF_LOCUS6874 [Hexamita inflata]